MTAWTIGHWKEFQYYLHLLLSKNILLTPELAFSFRLLNGIKFIPFSKPNENTKNHKQTLSQAPILFIDMIA